MWPDARPLTARVAAPPAARVLELLTLAPAPPVIVVEAVPGDARRRVLPELPDAAWWDRAWEVRVTTGVFAAARRDTVVPWERLGALGLPTSLDLVLSVPDSALTARVWELVWEEKLSLSELSDYFRAIGRGRAYADLKSREAAMFDEFRYETVPVTPRGDD